MSPIRHEGRKILRFWFIFAVASAPALAIQLPSNASAASESLPEVEAISARFVFTLIPHDGQPVTYGGKFYRYRQTVRFEPDTLPGKDPEIQLIDSERQLFYRIFPQERIYFEQRLTPAQRDKAVQQGWVAAPNSWREEKLLLKEDPWEGHSADLYLQIRQVPLPGTNVPEKEYSFLWLARDLNIPLRLAFIDPQSHPIIIEFRNLKSGPMDARLFRPPDDYSNLNPY